MPTTTRGSLPPGVYWRRRLALLTAAVVLVLLIGKLLGAGGGGGSTDQAQQVGAPASPTATVTVSASPTAAATKKGKKGRKNRGASETPSLEPTPTPTTPPPLADPTGPCADDDVFMTPSVTTAVGGSDVSFLLNFQTAQSAACTFDLSSDSVRVKIAKGPDTVWQSSECPKAVPTQEIVVRSTAVTQVPMVWNAKRSDEDCSDRTAKVLPDTYTISSSVLGGEPTVVDFDLTAPAPPVVTETVHPTIPATPGTSATPAG